MTQYYDAWALDTLDAAPSSSRWTPYGFAGTSGYWTGKVKDTGGGVRAVQPRDDGFGAPGWGAANVGYTRAELGTYSPGGSETIEMALLFRFPSGQGGYSGGLKFGNYYASPVDGTHWALTYGNPGSGGYVGGSSAVSYTVTANTPWWALVRRTGAGVYTLWTWDAAASQGSALITTSADTSATSGGIGFFAYEFPGKIDILAVGIGTNGDAAPTSAPASFKSAWARGSNILIGA